MGTHLRLTITAHDRSAALAASEAALGALLAAQERLSTWSNTGELALLNAAPPDVARALSPLLARDLARCDHWWRATSGAFDPALAPLVAAWDLRGRGRVPSPTELTAAREASGWRRGTLQGQSYRRSTPRPLLDEGGFGKGAGLADALAALAASGAQAGLLDLGGQLALFGPREQRLSLADPRDRQRPVLELTISAGSLATSGNSERSLAADGLALGPLLDPRSGHPAATTGSCTVWTPSPLDADCLSTALFVMGPREAWAWQEKRASSPEALPPVELLLLDWRGDTLRAVATPGFSGRLRPLTDDIELTFPVAGEAPWN